MPKFKEIPIITLENVPTGCIFLIALATEEEIKNGYYIEFNGMKISFNPKKHGIIKDVKS